MIFIEKYTGLIMKDIHYEEDFEKALETFQLKQFYNDTRSSLVQLISYFTGYSENGLLYRYRIENIIFDCPSAILYAIDYDYFEHKAIVAFSIKDRIKVRTKEELNAIWGIRSLSSRNKCAKPDINDMIEKVIFNDPATIVIWRDGTKTVVKCSEGDIYSKEVGLAMCIIKKLHCGNHHALFKKWCKEEE